MGSQGGKPLIFKATIVILSIGRGGLRCGQFQKLGQLESELPEIGAFVTARAFPAGYKVIDVHNGHHSMRNRSFLLIETMPCRKKQVAVAGEAWNKWQGYFGARELSPFPWWESLRGRAVRLPPQG